MDRKDGARVVQIGKRKGWDGRMGTMTVSKPSILRFPLVMLERERGKKEQGECGRKQNAVERERRQRWVITCLFFPFMFPKVGSRHGR